MRTPYIPHVFGDAVAQKLRSRIGWFGGAVASSIPWPPKDVWIQYAGDDFILRGTENGEQRRAPSITMPGTANQWDECLAKLYRFTSVLGWFLDGEVDVVHAIHGSHPPNFGVGYGQARSAVGQWGDKRFNCNHMPIIEDENTRIALAFFREGMRLSGVNDSYAFLSFFKVIESQHADGPSRVAWFNRNIDLMTDDAAKRVADLRVAGEDVGLHLWDSGRNAVAHATFGKGIVDPDIPADRKRISADLVLMKELARRFIGHDLGVPTARSLYEVRNRLEPWESLIDPQALATLKASGTPDLGLLDLDGLQVAVSLWPDEPMPDLDAMTMRLNAVNEGVVWVLLLNDRMTLAFTFALDFRNGRVYPLLEESGLIAGGEHTEEDVRAYYTVLHSVIGNAVVELRLLGREPIDCEEVHPVNIIPSNPAEAVEEAVEAFRQEQGIRVAQEG